MKTTPFASYALLILFGGVLMVLGITLRGDLAGHVVFLAFGTINLVAAGVLRILSGRRS